MLLRSNKGEVQTLEAWQKEVDDFWRYAELQNRYICNPRAKNNRRVFKRPVDAFERYARLLGLEPVDTNDVSYKGVF